MPTFDIPIVRPEESAALARFWDGYYGRGPKVERPDLEPRIVQIEASDIPEAARLVEQLHPGWVTHPSILGGQ